ncbi:MAG: MarR family transcriptional regulator [Deltaproteobacteria bacterium]|nr:MarR family transcriptional regulator [Deltaproteobacteria bacterium]
MASAYDESILRSLRRITRAIDLYSKQLASRYQLTGPQLVCLRTLSQLGEITPSQLATQICLSQATVSGILDRLERRKLVTRERDPSDKRRVNLQLTEEGKGLVESAPAPLHQRFAERLSKLPLEQQAEIDQILQRIVGMMEADELDASPILSAGPISAEPTDVTEFLDPGPKD